MAESLSAVPAVNHDERGRPVEMTWTEPEFVYPKATVNLGVAVMLESIAATLSGFIEDYLRRMSSEDLAGSRPYRGNLARDDIVRMMELNMRLRLLTVEVSSWLAGEMRIHQYQFGYRQEPQNGRNG